MITFRQKDFSIISSTLKGATLGTGIGTLAASLTGLLPKEKKNVSMGKVSIPKKLLPLAVTSAGTLIGAALGALGGLVVKGSEVINKSNVDNRLMSTVRDYLIRTGFEEGKSFTLDPKIATDLKTRVCIVITKNSGELRVLINTAADPKLKKLTDDTIKNIHNTSVITKSASDKFNEVTLTSISDSSADAGLISGIAEKFIRSGYPVYLVEVG